MAYRESFYRFLMTQRNPGSADDIAQFANNAQHDSSFPKQEEDYEKIIRLFRIKCWLFTKHECF